MTQHRHAPGRQDVLSWLALGSAFTVTAYGEYQLGYASGFGPYIAAGIPASLDIYVLRALQLRRDVGRTVIAMITVNALSHLVSAGLIPISVPLVIAVSAIAPLVLWRVHALQHSARPPAHRAELGAATAHPSASQRPDAPQEGDHPGPGGDQEPQASITTVSRPNPSVALAHPALQPAAIPAAQHPSAVHATWTPETAASGPETDPDAPAQAATDAPDADELLPDAQRLDEASRARYGRPASLRRLQNELQIGQPRAQRIRRLLDAPDHT